MAVAVAARHLPALLQKVVVVVARLETLERRPCGRGGGGGGGVGRERRLLHQRDAADGDGRGAAGGGGGGGEGDAVGDVEIRQPRKVALRRRRRRQPAARGGGGGGGGGQVGEPPRQQRNTSGRESGAARAGRRPPPRSELAAGRAAGPAAATVAAEGERQHARERRERRRRRELRRRLRPAAPAARGAAGADFGRAAEDESLIGSSEGGSSRSLYLKGEGGARAGEFRRRIAPNCAELRGVARRYSRRAAWTTSGAKQKCQSSNVSGKKEAPPRSGSSTRSVCVATTENCSSDCASTSASASNAVVDRACISRNSRSTASICPPEPERRGGGVGVGGVGAGVGAGVGGVGGRRVEAELDPQPPERAQDDLLVAVAHAEGGRAEVAAAVEDVRREHLVAVRRASRCDAGVRRRLRGRKRHGGAAAARAGGARGSGRCPARRGRRCGSR